MGGMAGGQASMRRRNQLTAAQQAAPPVLAASASQPASQRAPCLPPGAPAAASTPPVPPPRPCCRGLRADGARRLCARHRRHQAQRDLLSLPRHLHAHRGKGGRQEALELGGRVCTATGSACYTAAGGNLRVQPAFSNATLNPAHPSPIRLQSTPSASLDGEPGGGADQLNGNMGSSRGPGSARQSVKVQELV